jgi:hypothetical protein
MSLFDQIPIEVDGPPNEVGSLFTVHGLRLATKNLTVVSIIRGHDEASCPRIMARFFHG